MAFRQSLKGRAELRSAEAIGHAGVGAEAVGARLAAWAAQDAEQAAEQAAEAAAKARQAASDAKEGAQEEAVPAGRYFVRADDSRTRRLVAQEFVTQLKRIGSGSTQQLYGDGMSFFSCRPQDPGAIDYVGKMAQRYGWAKQTDGVWSATDSGNALTPPPSLAINQVLTRIFSLADPVRSQATNWAPLVAIVVGATAGATAIKGFGTLDVIRVLALSVLVVSVAIQFWGGCRIVRAFNQWREPPTWTTNNRTTKDDHYGWSRLTVNGLFDLVVIAAFGLLIFWQPIPLPKATLFSLSVEPWLWTVVVVGVVIASLSLVLEFRWRRRRKDYVDARRLDTGLGWRAKPITG